MKYRCLTIANIASIEHAVLDFTAPPLDRCPLFLIGGDTGSGKSTLLDAICLSLYGRTPRLGQVGKDSFAADGQVISFADARQYLRRGTGHGEAVFEFEGNDGHRYRACWAVRRARGKADGNLQEIRHSLEDCDSGITLERKKEVVDRVTEVIGLTYEQFVRTAILAQGDFARFLRSSANEKSEILEKMTGTTLYTELGRKIYDKTMAHRRVLEDLTRRDADHALLADEERAALEAQRDAGRQRCDELRKAVEADRDRIALLDRRAELIAALSRLDERLPLLRERLQVVAGGCDDLQARCARAEADITRREALLAPYRALAPTLERIDALTAHCGHIMRLWDNIARATAQVERLNDGMPALVNRLEHDARALDMPVDGLTVEVLNGLEADIDREDTHLQALVAAHTAWDNARAEHAMALKRRDETASEVERDTAARQPLAAELEQARAAARTAQTMYEKLELSLSDTLNEARNRLSAGDVCPLCGQTVAVCPSEGHFESLLAPQRELRDRTLLRQQHAEAELRAHERLAGEHNRQLRQADLQLSRRAADVETCLAALRQAAGDEAFDPTGFDSGKATRQHEQCVLRRPMVRRAREALQTRDLALADLDALNRSMADDRHAVDEAVAAVTPYAPAPDWLDRLRDERAAYVERLAADARHLTGESRALEAARAVLATDRALLAEARAVLAALPEALTPADEPAAPTSCPDPAGEARALRDDALAWQTERATHTRQLAAVDDRIARLTPDEAGLETLRERMARAEEQYGQLLREMGALATRLDNDTAERARHAHRLDEIARQRGVCDRWERLNSLMGSARGDVMRNIALSFVLDDLLRRANAYLRRFNDHYSLTCDPGSLNILVNDHYNGMMRCGPAMLSGGETFMVSLALALALARVNADGGSGVDVLLIDEGFGSLGDNSLGQVMDALERLRDMGHSRVGIISHMAGLDERIATQVRVTRLDNTRSRVDVLTR